MTTSGMLNLGVAPRGWLKVFQKRGTVCATARASTSATTNDTMTKAKPRGRGEDTPAPDCGLLCELEIGPVRFTVPEFDDQLSAAACPILARLPNVDVLPGLLVVVEPASVGRYRLFYGVDGVRRAASHGGGLWVRRAVSVFIEDVEAHVSAKGELDRDGTSGLGFIDRLGVVNRPEEALEVVVNLDVELAGGLVAGLIPGQAVDRRRSQREGTAGGRIAGHAHVTIDLIGSRRSRVGNLDTILAGGRLDYVGGHAGNGWGRRVLYRHIE